MRLIEMQDWAARYAARRWPEFVLTGRYAPDVLMRHLMEEVGELAKSIREHNTAEVAHEAADCLFLLLRICEVHGVTLNEGARFVKGKLERRLRLIEESVDMASKAFSSEDNE